jgi:hypothetical protein
MNTTYMYCIFISAEVVSRKGHSGDACLTQYCVYITFRVTLNTMVPIRVVRSLIWIIRTKSRQGVLKRLPNHTTVPQYSWQCRGMVVSEADSFYKVRDEPCQNCVDANRGHYSGEQLGQCGWGFAMSLRCPYG